MAGGIDAVFGALADPTRRTIMELVAREGGSGATDLTRRLPNSMTRQGIAKHLAVLEHAGLVDRRRHGKEVRFHLRANQLEEAMSWMAGIAAEWDERLTALAELVAESSQVDADPAPLKKT